MRLKSNRVLLSETDVFSMINNTNKIDLGFLEHVVDPEMFRGDLDLISSRNYPLVSRVLEALQQKEIVLCCTDNTKTSLVYVYGMDASKSKVIRVFVNLSRLVKQERAVDREGNIQSFYRIQGGYEVLYNILLGAYAGLHAHRVYESNPTAVKAVRDIYTDLFSQCISRGKFGNPIDGEKFRFFVNFFFYNGTITVQDLAQMTRFPTDKANVCMTLYPEFFSSGSPKTLSQLIETIVAEFPSLARNNLNPTSFLLAAVSTLGDNAVYLLDNHCYLLSVVTHKARKSKVFPGYLLKTIESDSTRLQSTIYHSFL